MVVEELVERVLLGARVMISFKVGVVVVVVDVEVEVEVDVLVLVEVDVLVDVLVLVEVEVVVGGIVVVEVEVGSVLITLTRTLSFTAPHSDGETQTFSLFLTYPLLHPHSVSLHMAEQDWVLEESQNSSQAPQIMDSSFCPVQLRPLEVLNKFIFSVFFLSIPLMQIS